MPEIIPFSETGKTWSSEDHEKHGQAVAQYTAGAIDRDTCFAQIKAMLGTTETQAKTVQKVDFEPITAQPFYAPDPFDDAAEYIAACRAHGMTVHRMVLECAKEAEKAAQVAERRERV